MTNSNLTPEQILWGDFYRLLHDEAKEIRLFLLRAKFAKLAAFDAEQERLFQPTPVSPSDAKI
jgi:hypothetical protein